MVAATVTPTPPPTPSSRVVISILPSSKTVDLGSIFYLDIRVNAVNQMVDSARACVDYDPNYLSVVQIYDGGVLRSTLEHSYDNDHE